MVRVGGHAPDFSLPSHSGGNVSLSSYRGENPVVLAFYPGDETPVCTAQLCDYRDRWEEFSRRGAVVLGISAQSVESHARFAGHHRFPFPLLADPGCRVARAYGVKMPFLKMMKRAVFIIDRVGIVRYRKIEPLPFTRRRSGELLAVLDQVQQTT